MTAKLAFLCCHNFHAEIAQAITEEGWDDVVSVRFPACCGRPPLSLEKLSQLFPKDCEQIIILGTNVCLKNINLPLNDFPAARTISFEQCFHLIASHSMVNELIGDGGYLITPIWLLNWQAHLKNLGFAVEQADEFFQNFARELVLLDTGVDANAHQYFAELSRTINLPVRRIAVGLDYVRQILTRLRLEWRLEHQQRQYQQRQQQHSTELANYVCAMDMLSRLAYPQKESEVIAAIIELFQMLFAPEAVYYLRVENDIAHPLAEIPAEVEKTMRNLQEKYAITPDNQGFLLRIGYDDKLLGQVAVVRLTFPEYLHPYLNMALALIEVCGLAIENARNRQKLVEAEKMASLAILVAGVAHEINTPLGVGLMAASNLQQQSRQLARRFAERSMTQSDLSGYLDTVEKGTGLLCNNLERIGHLIDAFRQVAVNNKAMEKRLFCLKHCLDGVIASLGSGLQKDKISVQIDCEPTLEIESFPDDWVSIFINLIGNSLKHGFKGREGGLIQIQIQQNAKKVRLDYRDDGVGLAPEALNRIFDPFFTTDLQHGMGLGMHLVYNLITHRMAGTIQCDSQAGQGVHFHIEVPR